MLGMMLLSRHNKKSLFNNSSESGVTLFLAIIVLSAIMAISFSLATILFVEIRTSGDLLKTESAINGADAVGEEVLFQVKRNVPNFSYSTQVGSASLDTPAATTIQDPILQDQVLKTSNDFSNTTNIYLLPGDSNRPDNGSGYGKIRVTYLDTGNNDNLVAYVCEFIPDHIYNSLPCSDKSSSAGYWLARDISITPFTDQSNREWLLDPSKQQELILYNDCGNYCSMGKTIYVQIEAFGLPTPHPCAPTDYDDGTNCYAPKGIPYFGEQAVDITAKASGMTRKIRVLAPQ